jgi:hypothetical protein
LRSFHHALMTVGGDDVSRAHPVSRLHDDAVGALELQQTHGLQMEVMLCNFSPPRILTLHENANQDLKNLVHEIMAKGISSFQ